MYNLDVSHDPCCLPNLQTVPIIWYWYATMNLNLDNKAISNEIIFQQLLAINAYKNGTLGESVCIWKYPSIRTISMFSDDATMLSGKSYHFFVNSKDQLDDKTVLVLSIHIVQYSMEWLLYQCSKYPNGLELTKK